MDALNFLCQVNITFLYNILTINFLFLKGTPLHPICGPDKKKCWRTVEFIMISHEFDPNTKLPNSANDIAKCNCLPTCTTITYDTEISQSAINWNEYVAGVSRGTNKRFKE